MKSLITRGILIASLALTGSAAMATNLPAHKTPIGISHARAPLRVAPRLPSGQVNDDIGEFIQSMLGGGPVQYSRLMQDAARAQPSPRSSGSTDWSPSYDYSSSASSSASDSQAASDAENRAIQSMNDTNALNASMAAAEEANDAANAATLQTEINANN
jgi:hypothetical protein